MKAFRQLNVLIVDDDASDLKIFKRIFEAEGYFVQGCSDAPACMRALESMAFDVALLDQNMPGTDGVELLKSIKAVNPKLAVVIITNHADPKKKAEALRAGAADYLTKPVFPRKILDIIRKSAPARPDNSDKI